MTTDRNVILHVLRGPWYGAAENAFNTFNKDLNGFSHVFMDLSAVLHGHETDEEYVNGVAAIQLRADQHVIPESTDIQLGENVLTAIVYDPHPAVTIHANGARILNWRFRRSDDGDGITTYERGRTIYPLMDMNRFIGLAGRVTKPTIGVFWDPHTEPPLHTEARIVSNILHKEERLVVSRQHYSGTEEYQYNRKKAEVREVSWEIGFDWMYGSLCDVAVCQASDYYPYMLVACMGMGKPCVVVDHSNGDLPEFVRDRVNCLVCRSPDQAGKMVRWLLNNKEPARKLGAAAQFSVTSHDVDANMMKLRKEVIG